ncbi:hypothetical protein [Streptomyces sp. NRRL F-2664]|uniref:hypothetical protein n=1 Tax=Streptomyces sp. NRRL F-2664 TaxID=1463842 RepID=UPI0004CBF7A3|nr:hypothetical protein [Streptomyces sp. NRRL F-2664]
MTDGERSALDRVTANLRSMKEASDRLRVQLAKATEVGWQAIGMMREAELAGLREHPDLAELEVWLDGLYGEA